MSVTAPAHTRSRIESVRAIPLLAELETPQSTGVATYTKLGITLVEVRTDDGLVGYGECLGRYAPRIWAVIVDELLAPFAIGASPFDTERLWNAMFRDLRSFSGHNRGMFVEAIAGVDIALWDLKGKITGRPLYDLIGGKVRERIPVYASSIMVDERAAIEREAAGLVERGFRAIKVKIGRDMEQDAGNLRAIRKVVGDKVELMIDANGAYNAAQAITFARMIEPLNIAWFEEPVVVDDIEGYERIRAATTIPLAAAEGEFTRFGVRDLLARGVLDVVQPDVARAGGVSETRKIIDYASAHHVRYCPHVGFSGAVCAATSLHLAASATNFWTYEAIYTANPLREALATEDVADPARLVDGTLAIPEGPGIGIELDPEAIERFRLKL